MSDTLSAENFELTEEFAIAFCLCYVETVGGNIGCLVNGAGLAMATMDLIKSYG